MPKLTQQTNNNTAASLYRSSLLHGFGYNTDDVIDPSFSGLAEAWIKAQQTAQIIFLL